MRTRVLLSLLFSLSVALCVSARADTLPDAETLRATVDRAAGPQPKNYTETIDSTGAFGDTHRVTYRDGSDYRTVVDRGPLHNEYGTFHGEDWHQNANGMTVIEQPDPGKATTEATTTSVLRAPSSPTMLVIATLNARGYGTRDFVDSASSHIVKHEYIDALGTTATQYNDFKPFAGRVLASTWTITNPDKASQTYTRTAYVAGSATPADLAIPPIRRTLVEFPAGTASAELPVLIDRGDIFVHVKIGEGKFDFALDTGASEIFIDPGVARSMHLKVFDAGIATIAQRVPVAHAVIPTMTVGPLTLHNIVVGVAPMPEGQRSMTGLLGFDFIAQLGLTIDYDNGRVTAVPAGAFVPPVGPRTIGFEVRLGDDVPMTTVTIDGSVGERFVVDTGSQKALLVFDYFGRAHPQAFRKPVGETQIIGVGGLTGVTIYQFDEVTLANIRFKGYRGLRIASIRSYAGEEDGAVGAEFLSLFTVNLDYAGGHIYLTPNRFGDHLWRAR